MPLPTSGAISLSQVNTELGLAANTLISMNDTGVRTLAGQPSGQTDLNTLHGKSAVTGTLLTMVAAPDAISPTSAVSYFYGNNGSLTPPYYKSFYVYRLLTYTPNVNKLWFDLYGTVPRGYFSSIYIQEWDLTILESSVTNYTQNATLAHWAFTVPFLFVSGSTYHIYVT